MYYNDPGQCEFVQKLKLRKFENMLSNVRQVNTI